MDTNNKQELLYKPSEEEITAFKHKQNLQNAVIQYDLEYNDRLVKMRNVIQDKLKEIFGQLRQVEDMIKQNRKGRRKAMQHFLRG